MKPRIWKSRYGRWYCVGDYVRGCGNSMSDAYRAWEQRVALYYGLPQFDGLMTAFPSFPQQVFS